MMQRSVKGNLLAGQFQITKIDYYYGRKVANYKQGTNLFFLVWNR